MPAALAGARCVNRLGGHQAAQEESVTLASFIALASDAVAATCHRAECVDRLCCHKYAQEEPAAWAGFIALASDAVEAPYHRAGCDHRLRCHHYAQEEPAAQSMAMMRTVATSEYAAVYSHAGAKALADGGTLGRGP